MDSILPEPSFKNNARIFSALNWPKNKKIQPGPEKQLTYVKKMSVIQTYLPS